MSVNEQTMQGDWNQLKGRAKQKWGELTDDDFSQAEGSVDRLIGTIQEKTGETRSAIEEQLSVASQNSAETLAAASEAVRNAAASASEQLQCASQQVAASVQTASEEAKKQVEAGYVQTKRMVQQRPVESIATVFGVGIVTGLIAGLLMRSR